MKKIITFMLAAALIVLTAACTPKKTADNTVTPDPTPTVTEPTQTVTEPTPTVTPKKDPVAFNVNDYIKNAELWNGPRMFNTDSFHFLVEYTDERMVRDNMGITYKYFYENVLNKPYEREGAEFLHTPDAAGEWENALLCEEGREKAYGYPVKSSFFPNEPKTIEEAYDRIQEFLYESYAKYAKEGTILTSLNCAMPWHHYAAEAGYRNLGTEIGCSISSYQFKMAVNRGAAKQYGASWFINFSPWFHTTFPDYGETPRWEGISSKTGGHSLSLIERSLLLSYMEGADATIAEGAEYICYYSDDENADITPYGELLKKINAFTKTHNDIGTAYTPYGIILDKYHGINSGEAGQAFLFSPNNVMHLFPMLNTDEFTYDVFNKVIWKGSFDADMPNDECDVMINSKYGEAFDCFLPNVSYELLSTYPVLIFTGEIQLSGDEQKKYAEYVKNGGKIVLNTAQVYLFDGIDVELPSNINKQNYAEVKYGSGSFYIYGKGGLPQMYTDKKGETTIIGQVNWQVGGLETILNDLNNEYMPFSFSSEIGYSVSMKEDTIYLYVFNNDGVSKTQTEEAVIDNTKAIDLTINYLPNNEIISVEDIYNHHDIAFNDNTMSVHLDAGDMAVIEIKLK